MMFSGGNPIFEQLASYFRRLILAGGLRQGDPLPSVREVALSERINPNTAQRAYQVLMEEGLIVSIPKKGYFVADKIPNEKDEKLKTVLRHLLKEGYSEADIIAALEETKGEKDD